MTKTASPETCHVFPFSANNNESKLTTLRRSEEVMAYWIVGPKLLRHPGCSDKAWNMICLSRQLHKWWGECLWAFKCLGISFDGEDDATIHLQFHWMPATTQEEDDR